MVQEKTPHILQNVVEFVYCLICFYLLVKIGISGIYLLKEINKVFLGG